MRLGGSKLVSERWIVRISDRGVEFLGDRRKLIAALAYLRV